MYIKPWGFRRGKGCSQWHIFLLFYLFFIPSPTSCRKRTVSFRRINLNRPSLQMEKLSEIEKTIWLIGILSGDPLGKGRETKSRCTIDLGENTKAKGFILNPSIMRAMRNIVQNYTGKAVRKIAGITTAEKGRFFVDFYTKNPWSFVSLYSPTTLWKVSEGLMWLWSSLAQIKFWAPSPEADRGVAGCLTAVRSASPNSTKCPVFKLKCCFRNEEQK